MVGGKTSQTNIHTLSSTTEFGAVQVRPINNNSDKLWWTVANIFWFVLGFSIKSMNQKPRPPRLLPRPNVLSERGIYWREGSKASLPSHFYSARHFLPGCLCWSSLLTKQLCCNPPPFKSLPWHQYKALPSVFTLQIILRENKEQEGRIKENIIKGCL